MPRTSLSRGPAMPMLDASASSPAQASACAFSAAFAALWVPETKILGGQIGLSLGSSYSFAWLRVLHLPKL